MKAARLWALTGSIGLGVSFLAAAGAATAATRPPSGRVALSGSLAPKAERAHPAGTVSAKSTVSFDLTLKVRNGAAMRMVLRQCPFLGAHRVFVRQRPSHAWWGSVFGRPLFFANLEM